VVPDLGDRRGALRQIALTPDGTTLLYSAFVGGRALTMRRALDAAEATPVSGVSEELAGYVISANARHFIGASYDQQRFYRHPISGGTGQPLPPDVPWSTSVALASDGSLWLTATQGARQGHVRVSSTDSITRPFGGRNSDLAINQILPGDRAALAIRVSPGTTAGPAFLLNLVTGDAEALVNADVVEIRYAAGYLIYVLNSGAMEARPFDLNALAVRGSATLVATDVSLTGSGLAQFSVATNGTVAYVPEAPRSLVLVDRDGARRTALEERRNYHSPRFSPDGKSIAVDFNSADGRDVWILSLPTRALTRVTFDRNGHDPNWEPNGRTLLYTSISAQRLGIRRIKPGRVEPAESVLVAPELAHTGIMMPDARGLITVANDLKPGSRADIAIIRNGGRGPIEPLVATRFQEEYPALTRDGRWLAYTSTLSGRSEVYVRPVEGANEHVQVSTDGGTEPVWSPNGRELFYRAGVGAASRLVVATIEIGTSLRVTSRRVLFPLADILVALPHANFDVSPDGRTFVMVQQNRSTLIMLIQNLPGLIRRINESAS
jgi:serine/threonine-protein kinase